MQSGCRWSAIHSPASMEWVRGGVMAFRHNWFRREAFLGCPDCELVNRVSWLKYTGLKHGPLMPGLQFDYALGAMCSVCPWGGFFSFWPDPRHGLVEMAFLRGREGGGVVLDEEPTSSTPCCPKCESGAISFCSDQAVDAHWLDPWLFYGRVECAGVTRPQGAPDGTGSSDALRAGCGWVGNLTVRILPDQRIGVRVGNVTDGWLVQIFKRKMLGETWLTRLKNHIGWR